MVCRILMFVYHVRYTMYYRPYTIYYMLHVCMVFRASKERSHELRVPDTGDP